MKATKPKDRAISRKVLPSLRLWCVASRQPFGPFVFSLQHLKMSLTLCRAGLQANSLCNFSVQAPPRYRFDSWIEIAYSWAVFHGFAQTYGVRIPGKPYLAAAHLILLIISRYMLEYLWCLYRHFRQWLVRWYVKPDFLKLLAAPLLDMFQVVYRKKIQCHRW